MTRSSLVASSTGQVTWLGATEYARLLVRTQCGDRFANNLADTCDLCFTAMRLAHPDNNEVRARHYDYVLAKIAARHKSIARCAGQSPMDAPLWNLCRSSIEPIPRTITALRGRACHEGCPVGGQNSAATDNAPVQVQQPKPGKIASCCEHCVGTHESSHRIELKGHTLHAERPKQLALRKITHALRTSTHNIADDPRQHHVAAAAITPSRSRCVPQRRFRGDGGGVGLGEPDRCRNARSATFIEPETRPHPQKLLDGNRTAFVIAPFRNRRERVEAKLAVADEDADQRAHYRLGNRMAEEWRIGPRTACVALRDDPACVHNHNGLGIARGGFRGLRERSVERGP